MKKIIKYRFLKIFVLSLIIILANFKIVYAEDVPSIQFEGFLGKKPGPSLIGETLLSYPTFARSLGLTPKRILNDYSHLYSFDKLTKSQPYNFYYLELDFFYIARGIYILSNNKTIGYSLLEPFEIQGLEDEPFIQQIKLLPQNQDLVTKLTLPPGTSITFYEKETANFMERYAIARVKGRVLLLLDAFYLKNLENKIQPEIIEVINFDLQAYNNDNNF